MALLSIPEVNSANLSIGPASIAGPSGFTPSSIGTSTQGSSLSFRPGGGSVSIQTAVSQNYSGFTPSAPTSMPGASQLRLPGTGIGARTEAEAGVGRLESTTTSNQATTGGGSGAGGAGGTAGTPGSEPTQVCPICKGEYLTQKEGRTTLNIAQYLQRFGDVVISVLDLLLGRPKKVSVQTALKECGACKNKRTFKDPTNDPAKNAQAGQIAQNISAQVQEAESKLGPIGGNEYKIVAGSVLHEIGLSFNDTQAYEIHQDGAPRRWGLAGPGEGGVDPKYSLRALKGGTTNLVVGKSVPSSPGGHYIIKCSNKFSILAGAQGVDITTGGPVVINGGITKITGPQVTIGASSAGGSGGLALEGDVITAVAKSFEVTPTDGQFNVLGSTSTTGNHMCGGMVYGENAAFVKMSTTSKNDHTKVGSSSNLYSGPAVWQDKAVKAALRELKAFVAVNTTHPKHVFEVGPASLRYSKTIKDNALNVAYSSRPQELVPTGYALVPGLGKCPVFNFPHIHAMHDQTHVHSTVGPNITTYDSDEALRSAVVGVDGPAPYHGKSDKSESFRKKTFDVINAAWIAMGGNTLENTFNV